MRENGTTSNYKTQWATVETQAKTFSVALQSHIYASQLSRCTLSIDLNCYQVSFVDVGRERQRDREKESERERRERAREMKWIHNENDNGA